MTHDPIDDAPINYLVQLYDHGQWVPFSQHQSLHDAVSLWRYLANDAESRPARVVDAETETEVPPHVYSSGVVQFQ